MITTSVLKEVAAQANITDHYRNAWGQETEIAPAILQKLLAAIGYDTRDDHRLLASAAQHNQQALPTVKILRDNGSTSACHLPWPDDWPTTALHWQLQTEHGECYSGQLANAAWSERAGKHYVTLELPALPWGYHQLQLTLPEQGYNHQLQLIVTPSRCYQQPQLQQGKKSWGPSIQLYMLRSRYNWGMGDFGDLKSLVAEIAALGGDFIGLNPLHALFPRYPESVSPYSPSSRRWLNILYIDVSSVPEFMLCSEAQEHVGTAAFQHRLQQVRTAKWIDYPAVAALKMQILPLLFSEFQQRHLSHNTERAQAYWAFVTQGGEDLQQQATFDALHHWLWSTLPTTELDVPALPAPYDHYERPEVQQFISEHADEVQFYMYLQWLADCQLQEAQQLAEQKGMTIGLYRDLAIGVTATSAEHWADHNVLLDTVNVGAPPDVLGPLGQNWGLLPFAPNALTAHAYQPFIKLLRANMRHCGALRIDHVLGLLRLWWIPEGDSAANGAYLAYPVDDMLALLALESHRQQCTVIGEDLGTVPEQMSQRLAEAGIFSYKVFFFERNSDGSYRSPADYPALSLAALSTHDMPTIRGFWQAKDLEMGRQLGLYPDTEQWQQLCAERHSAIRQIVSYLQQAGYLNKAEASEAQTAMTPALQQALQLNLAHGKAALLSIQLEDWLNMELPLNIPGTTSQYPNWRRKLSTDLEVLFHCSTIKQLGHQLTEARQRSTASPSIQPVLPA